MKHLACQRRFLMAKDIWYMMVSNDEYELPCCPPYPTMRKIAKHYGISAGSVANAIDRKSKTKNGKIIKIERNVETVEDRLILKIDNLEDQVDDLESRLRCGICGVKVLKSMIKEGYDNGKILHTTFILDRLESIYDEMCAITDYDKVSGL